MKQVIAGAVLLIAGFLMGLGVANTAGAQEYSAPYIEFETNLDGEVELTLGGWTGGQGLDAYAEGSWIGDEAGTNWELELGTTVDLSFVETTLAGKYVWGDDNGKDLIGFGDNNQWGDLYAHVAGEVKPGLIGGEYFFAETDLLVESPVDIDFDSIDMGVGYNLNLGDRAYVDGRMIWTAERNWEVNQSGVGIKIGFKF